MNQDISKLLISASKNQIEATMQKHIANAYVLINNPTGLADHPDIIETILKEISLIGKYQGELEALDKFFES